MLNNNPRPFETTCNKDISVIIVNYNARNYLQACLSSLLESSVWPQRIEVIVVDNASSDQSTAMVREQFEDFHLIANDTNLGFAAANNQGIEESTGRYVLLLNPDTIVPSGTLEHLLDFMDTRPDAAACGPRLINPDGSTQLSCRRFPTPLAVLIRGTPLNRFLGQSRPLKEYLMLDWNHSEIRTVGWVLGACLMMRRQALEEIGLLDEGFFVYYEDIDWCYRAWQSQWKIYYNPFVKIPHYYQRTSSRIFNWAIIYHLKSIFRLYRKHGLGLNKVINET